MSRSVEFLGVFSPSMAAVAEPQPANPALTHTILPGALTGLAGVALWPKHRLLGFFAGEALGMNAARIVRGAGPDRTLAACNIAMTTSAITGSLVWKKHPALGFFAGLLAGALITSAVPGSNAYNFRKKVF